MTIEKPWNAGILHSVNPLGMRQDVIKLARIYTVEDTVYCMTIQQYDEESSDGYISIFRPFSNENKKNFSIKGIPARIGQDNFRQKGMQVYFYNREDSAYHFSLSGGKPVKDEQYPFEKVGYVNGVTAPGGNYLACWSDINLFLKDTKTGKTERLWHEEYRGDWSIGEVVWSPDAKKLYFDNTGPVACIWEYDLENSSLNKIVTDHDAVHPSVFSRNGYDYVGYVQDGTVRFATEDPMAEGAFPQDFISDGSVDFPVAIRSERDQPEMLDVIFFDEAGKEDGFSFDQEEWYEMESVYKLGTITSEPYRAGILYRIDIRGEGKMESQFSTLRCIRTGEKLILLPLSSSDRWRIRPQSDERYSVNINDGILHSEPFLNCTGIIIDSTVAVKGMLVPGMLGTEAGRYAIPLVRETILDEEQVSLKKQLEFLYTDDLVGDVYVEKEPRQKDKPEELKYFGGGLFAFTADRTMLVYAVTPEFDFTIINRKVEKRSAYAYVTDAGYNPKGSGSLDLACIYNAGELEGLIRPCGTTNNGDTIWSFDNFDNVVFMQEYNRIKKAFSEVSYEGMEPLPDVGTFIGTLPVYFWKDPFGRYIRFLRKKFLTPQLAEPIVYIYDDMDRTVKIGLGERVEVTRSYPEMDKSWTVRGSATGRVVDAGSGKPFDHLFWEGFAGFLPHPNTGFVVMREELPTFFDSKLTELGLAGREISEFKEAWLDDLSESPWYLITFYNQELIDRYAPLHMEPRPETMIRVLMDYKPLEKRIDVPEPVLPAPPPRKGLTLIEWGGLKR